jgi:lysozyme family protein
MESTRMTGKDVWDKAIAFVFAMEGIYDNDPYDPGGETKFGISKKAYPTLDIKNLTKEQAQAIYKRDYWEACSCDQLPAKIAIAVFDTAVNQGTGIARRMLQVALGLPVDFDQWENTITACFKAEEEKLLVLYLTQRTKRYLEIMSNNNTLKRYATNWMRRTGKLVEILFE